MGPMAVEHGQASKREWDVAVEGLGEIAWQVYEPPSGGRPFGNWLMRCPRHNCVKTHRVTDASTRNFGVIETIAWVHCWRDLPCDPDTKAKHIDRKTAPSKEAIAAWIAAHGAVAVARYPDVLG